MNKTTQLRKTPLKRTGNSLKRKPMRAKPVDPKYLQDRKAESEKMWEVYNAHWELKPHICEECTVKLYGENKNLYHHHLLEKGIEKYKHLKYELDNLMLLCADCHSLVTGGFPGIRVIERTKEAKKLFNIE